jgi:hypothetical protein
MSDEKYFPSFKVIWIVCTTILFLVSFYLIYTKQSSSGYTGGRYGNGSFETINGYGALMIAILFLIFGVVLFRPDRKKRNHNSSKEE